MATDYGCLMILPGEKIRQMETLGLITTMQSAFPFNISKVLVPGFVPFLPP